MEARDKLIKLNEKRQHVGHNLIAYITALLDLGYNLEEVESKPLLT